MIPSLPHSRSTTHRSISMSADIPTSMASYRQSYDPPHWPPPRSPVCETPEQVERISTLEHEAKLNSERIDRVLSLERNLKKKKKDNVRILLLGQSESGKSTTLKNFQLHFAPRAFRADSEAWRTVIYLNLIRSVIFIIDVLNAAAQTTSEVPRTIQIPSTAGSERETRRPRTAESVLTRSGGSLTGSTATMSGSGFFSSYPPDLRRLMLSLLPLKSIEATLNRRLATVQSNRPLCTLPCAEIPFPLVQPEQLKETFAVRVRTQSTIRPHSSHSTSTSTSSQRSLRNKHVLSLTFKRDSTSSSSTASLPDSVNSESLRQVSKSTLFNGELRDAPSTQGMTLQTLKYKIPAEFTVRVRGNSGWKHLARISLATSVEFNTDDRTLRKMSMDSIASLFSKPDHSSAQFPIKRSSEAISDVIELRELQAVQQILEACGEDIDKLWKHDYVQRLLNRAGIQVDKQPGFFLNDVKRVTSQSYVPTPDDILRARLATIGVEEHKIVIESGPEAGKEWTIYDVGGMRGQRAAWAQFFDNVNAVIFLAPVSSFDEWLAEDPNVNRLTDALHLWKLICSNRLLASVGLILFLNKYDILRDKLRAGVRFSNFVLDYDDDNGKKNDAESVARYTRKLFTSLHKKVSLKPRRLRTYMTSVIDSPTTAKLLQHIREQILVEHLADSNVI